MSDKLLTTKQFNFCLEYVKNPSNATQAAITAGYSRRSAQQRAAENVSKSVIREKIAELRQKAEDGALMGVTERKKVLAEIGRAAVTEFVDTEGNIDLAGGRPGVISEVTVKDWRGGKGGRASSRTKAIKVYSKLQAIDLLNKMEGIYTDGAHVSIDNRKVEILVNSEPVKALLSEIIEGVAPHAYDSDPGVQ